MTGESGGTHRIVTGAQILDGIILEAWRAECGYPSLNAFAASKPSASKLRNVAQSILRGYTDPIDESIPETSKHPVPDSDITVTNLKRMTGHLLFVGILQAAIKDGDFGRIEDMQGHLVMMFCAGGGKNYCTELLHFIMNLKYVWTPEFA